MPSPSRLKRGREWVSESVSPDGSRALTPAELLHTAFMSSLLPNGASGPMLSTMSCGAEEHGVDRVTVAAGTFCCHVFDDGNPDEHVWCAGDDLIFVKIRGASRHHRRFRTTQGRPANRPTTCLMTVFSLRRGVQRYAWGSPTLMARQFGWPVTGEPMAELWVGDHPSLPSSVHVDGHGSRCRT